MKSRTKTSDGSSINSSTYALVSCKNNGSNTCDTTSNINASYNGVNSLANDSSDGQVQLGPTHKHHYPTISAAYWLPAPNTTPYHVPGLLITK